MIKKYKRSIAIVVIVTTFCLLGWYIAAHPAILNDVLRVSPTIIGMLFLLYLGIIATHFVVMYAAVQLCGKTVPVKEGVFLTIYSTMANFFGPLQTGPGVRAVYLKQKIGLRVRDYTKATLFYYFIFAAISCSLLFVNTLPVLTLIGLLSGGALVIAAIRLFRIAVPLRWVGVTVAVTAVQAILMSLIYYIELMSVDPAGQYTYWQALVYTGSANLSLFVAITPGAIGIREMFIVFAQSLHDIPLATVVAAGIVDRSMYVLLLVVLFASTSGMHLKDMFVHKKVS